MADEEGAFAGAPNKGVKGFEMYIPGLTERVEKLEEKVEELHRTQALLRKGRVRRA